MKSNTNQVREEVRKYILECMNFEGYNMQPTAANVFKTFRNEYEYPYSIKRYPNQQARFCEWLKGCPTVLQVSMCYNEVREILINRFKTNTPAKRDDVKSFNYFLALIYMELKRMEAEPQKQSTKLLSKIEKSFK